MQHNHLLPFFFLAAYITHNATSKVDLLRAYSGFSAWSNKGFKFSRRRVPLERGTVLFYFKVYIISNI